MNLPDRHKNSTWVIKQVVLSKTVPHSAGMSGGVWLRVQNASHHPSNMLNELSLLW